MSEPQAMAAAMHWMYLSLAIVFEVSGTTCMKLSHGFTRPGWAVAMFVLYGIAFTCLTLSLKHIEIGIAYAVWAGAGTALIALISIALFDEGASWLKFASLLLIVAGIVGLNLSGGMH